MSAEIVDFPGGAFDTGGGDGTGGSMLERRVAALETEVKEMKAVVVRVETKIEGHDDALRRIEDALKFLAEDNRNFSKSLIDVREKVAHIAGRLANIPTFWQNFSLMAMMLIGIAGLIFTASKVFHP